MALAGNILSCRLPLLALKLRLLALDPGQPGNDKQALQPRHSLAMEQPPYPTSRWIHTKMKVFDVLANHINDKPMYGDLVLLSTHLDSSPVLKFDLSGSHLSGLHEWHSGLPVP